MAPVRQKCMSDLCVWGVGWLGAWLWGWLWDGDGVWGLYFVLGLCVCVCVCGGGRREEREFEVACEDRVQYQLEFRVAASQCLALFVPGQLDHNYFLASNNCLGPQNNAARVITNT